MKIYQYFKIVSKHWVLIFHIRVVEWFNKISNIHVQFFSNLLYFIFHFHHEDGKIGKILLLWEKVWLPTQLLETVQILFNLSTTYFMEGMERAKLPKFHHNLHLMLYKVFPAILCCPEGESFHSWSISWWDMIQRKICMILSNIISFYFSVQQMLENKMQCYNKI